MISRTLRSPGFIVIAAAVYLVAVLNFAFWPKLLGVVAPAAPMDWLLLGCVLVAVVAAHAAIITVFATRYVLKPLICLALPITAALGYFSATYGTLIDVNMVRNALQTNSAEAGDLIGRDLVAHVALLGVLPALLLAFARINWPPFRELFLHNCRRGAALVALLVVTVFPFLEDYQSLVRENRTLVLSLAPVNLVSAATKLASRAAARTDAPTMALGIGAHAARDVNRPAVTVVVVGETARAQNFSLTGYERQTNSELAKVPGLLAFRNVSSCGTDTAQSLPCMFSDLGRKAFTVEEAMHREGLLDVVRHAGLGVLWRENQSGCKGVCVRSPTEVLTTSTDPRFCSEGECHDEILLDGLAERIQAMPKGGLVVLHMMGSHGPAYFKRVPAGREVFKPTCTNVQLGKCTPDEIRNSYDNTIVYTDHVLALLIQQLGALDAKGIDTAMIYMSDHGESLGEHGLYLHGMPYMIAPSQQTHIPMLTWLSDGYKQALGLDEACLRQQADEATLSHDNLFHSVLGMLDIQTTAYRQELDLIGMCRPARLAASRPASTAKASSMPDLGASPAAAMP